MSGDGLERLQKVMAAALVAFERWRELPAPQRGEYFLDNLPAATTINVSIAPGSLTLGGGAPPVGFTTGDYTVYPSPVITDGAGQATIWVGATLRSTGDMVIVDSGTYEADLDITFDGKRNVPVKSDFASIDPHMGLELDYIQTIFLRLGAGNIQQVKDFDESLSTTFQPNFGVGVKIKKLNIDYAMTDIGDQAESLYSHVFSLKVGL